MYTSLYAALLALLIIKLSFSVIALRRANKISLGDGGHPDLGIAIRVHANATEYIPIALILLLALELQGIPSLVVHGFGLTFVLGRLMHAFALPVKNFRWRVIGMQITVGVIVLLAVINIVYVAWGVFAPLP